MWILYCCIPLSSLKLFEVPSLGFVSMVLHLQVSYEDPNIVLQYGPVYGSESTMGADWIFDYLWPIGAVSSNKSSGINRSFTHGDFR